MTENELDKAIRRLCRGLGLAAYHTRDSRGGSAVGAPKTGVNTTTEDRGGADRVTGGDRAKTTGSRQQKDEIRAEVDKIRGMFSPPLRGTTQWGPILISARATGVTHMSSDLL